MKQTLLAFLGASLLSTLCGADFTNAVIVHPANPTDWDKTAINELKTHLEQSLGKSFSAVSEKEFKGGSAIHVGMTDAVKKNLKDASSLEKQEWRIKDSGNQLFITGGSPTGTLYGVYDFLEKNGIYNIAYDCTVIPKRKKLEVNGMDVKSKPSFVFREIYHGLYYPMDWKSDPSASRSWNEYSRRNYTSWRREDMAGPYHVSYKTKQVCHSFYNYLPPAKYAKEHPEYYTLGKDGKRSWQVYNQLCFSNKDVRRLVKEQLMKWIAEDRKEKPENYPTMYDFSQMDGGAAFCYCAPCQAIIKKYGSETGLLFEFVNEMAEEAAKQYPDVYIQTFAYVNTEVPLDTIKPAKNVVVKYCDLYSRSNRMIPLRRQGERAKVLEDWTKQSPNVFLWDYWNFAITSGASHPEMIVDAVIDDLRYFKKIGVGGLFLEAEIGGENPYRPQSFAYLQDFLGRQLMKDASQDPEKLIGMFLENYYGPAAKPVRAYFEDLRKEVREKPSTLGELTTALRHVTPEFLMRSREILLNAMKLAGDDKKIRARVADELNVIDVVLIKRFRNYKISGLKKEDLIREYRENMLLSIDQNGIMSKEGKAKNRKALDTEIEIFNISYPLPAELKNYPEKDIRRLAYPHFPYGYEDAKVVKDPVSSMARSIAFLPSDQMRHKLPFALGFYDKLTKRSASHKISPSVADEQYHWYKVGRFEIGSQTILWAGGGWHMTIYLHEAFVNNDGMTGADNPNIYDIWVSARFAGPAYHKGSKNPNGVYIDRIVLARPQK